MRAGIQPFNADFRGFLFQDQQAGVRLFGDRDNNRLQYNLAYFRRINKDTMEVEATIEDPKLLTKPWTVPKQTLRLAPFDQIMALDCTGVESAALMEAAAKQNYGKKQQ